MLLLDLIKEKTEEEPKASDDLTAEIEALIQQRTEARANKDWATADAIRDKLKDMNVTVIDSKDGITWKINS